MWYRVTPENMQFYIGLIFSIISLFPTITITHSRGTALHFFLQCHSCTQIHGTGLSPFLALAVLLCDWWLPSGIINKEFCGPLKIKCFIWYRFLWSVSSFLRFFRHWVDLYISGSSTSVPLLGDNTNRNFNHLFWQYENLL